MICMAFGTRWLMIDDAMVINNIEQLTIAIIGPPGFPVLIAKFIHNTPII
jgi:hypothetical protein